MRVIKPVQNLIDEFQRLPSIGPKTAARLTYWLLKAPPEVSNHLAEALLELKKKTVICEVCFNVTDVIPCSICSDNLRDQSQLCVVEEALDVVAIEKTGKYHGLYHVLGGAISPVDGIGPEELRIKELIERLRNYRVSPILEVILATNPTMEGEATAMYIANEVRKLKSQILNLKTIRITRIARGLPTGADLEYADESTLSKALEGRVEY